MTKPSENSNNRTPLFRSAGAPLLGMAVGAALAFAFLWHMFANEPTETTNPAADNVKPVVYDVHDGLDVIKKGNNLTLDYKKGGAHYLIVVTCEGKEVDIENATEKSICAVGAYLRNMQGEVVAEWGYSPHKILQLNHSIKNGVRHIDVNW